MAHCHEQFFLAGWVVFCWELCARLFWDFAARRADWRRPDRHRDRMDAAEAARRRKARRAQNCPAAGHIPPGILSLDDATDSRPWINLRGDHAGRERGSPSLLPAFDSLGCTHWIGVDRDQHFALLWICGPVGANPGSNGDDGDHAIVVVFPSLYRCADCLERDQSTAGIGDAAFWLIRCTFPPGCRGLTGSFAPPPEFPANKEMIVRDWVSFRSLSPFPIPAPGVRNQQVTLIAEVPQPLFRVETASDELGALTHDFRQSRFASLVNERH